MLKKSHRVWGVQASGECGIHAVSCWVRTKRQVTGKGWRRLQKLFELWWHAVWVRARQKKDRRLREGKKKKNDSGAEKTLEDITCMKSDEKRKSGRNMKQNTEQKNSDNNREINLEVDAVEVELWLHRKLVIKPVDYRHWETKRGKLKLTVFFLLKQL